MKKKEQSQNIIKKFVKWVFNAGLPQERKAEPPKKEWQKRSGGGGCFGKPAWMRSQKVMEDWNKPRKKKRSERVVQP